MIWFHIYEAGFAIALMGWAIVVVKGAALPRGAPVMIVASLIWPIFFLIAIGVEIAYRVGVDPALLYPKNHPRRRK